jgi:hypothetical protein
MESCPAFPRERHGPGRVSPNPPFATAGTVPLRALIMLSDSGRFQAETWADLGLVKRA